MRISLKQFAKLSSSCKEIRIHLCQTSDTSKGVRDFISNIYPKIKKENPTLPILIRESAGVQPKLWIRSDMGKEMSFSLTNNSSADILKTIENVK